MTNRLFYALAAAGALFIQACAIAQEPKVIWPDPVLKEGSTRQLSPHVHVIPDGDIPAVPNVGIVVGDRAILVIDAGLGRRNGEIVLREIDRIGKRDQLLLAATHFHPDHTTGVTAFPATTAVILSEGAVADIAEFGPHMLRFFGQTSPYFGALLKDAIYPNATIVARGPTRIDLGGGVSVEAIPMGANHTRGDMVFLVKPDNILFTGDIVMDGAPQVESPYSSLAHWLSSLDQIEAMQPSLIVPDHGHLGGLALVQNYRAYFQTLLTRAGELKREGKSSEEAIDTLARELKPRFGDRQYEAISWRWEDRMRGSAAQAYKEAGSPR